LLKIRGFSADDFARSHPGGRLGRRLLLRVSNIMHREGEIPSVTEIATLRDALLEMTRKKLGMTAIVDTQGRALGIFTDGDLRRTLDKSIDIHHTPIKILMNQQYKKISAESLAVDALNLMETHKITALLVLDQQGILIGVIHMHDLLQAGVV